MAGALPSNTIIVKKKKKHKAHGSHGAWKVAFADFAIAMMAFFLVLWLQEATSVEEKQAISKFFNDPVGFEEGGSRYVIDFGGTAPAEANAMIEDKVRLKASEEEVEKVIDAETIKELARKAEAEKFKDLAEELKNKLEQNEALKPYKDQVIMNVTDEGLQVQIVDKQFRPMFASGSNKIKDHTRTILSELAKTLSSVPNKIVISGHTDAKAFNNRRGYTNWDLSSERANSARRTLQEAGVADQKIAQVVGHGSTKLFDEKDPLGAVNRRVSILVLSQDTQQRMEGGDASGDDENTGAEQQPAQQGFENPANVSSGKEAAGAVENFRRQQVLRSQQGEINDTNTQLINQSLESDNSFDGGDDFFEFQGDDFGAEPTQPDNRFEAQTSDPFGEDSVFEIDSAPADTSPFDEPSGGFSAPPPAVESAAPAQRSQPSRQPRSQPQTQPQQEPPPPPPPKPAEKPWWEE